MGYWICVRNNINSKIFLFHHVFLAVAEWGGAGRVMERQPGMSRETTDRERSVLFVQVCVCVCELHPPCLSVTEMWFQLGPFLKNQKHAGTSNKRDIFLKPTLLCSHFTTQTFPTLLQPGDVSLHFYSISQLSNDTDRWRCFCKSLHRYSHGEYHHNLF